MPTGLPTELPTELPTGLATRPTPQQIHQAIVTVTSMGHPAFGGKCAEFACILREVLGDGDYLCVDGDNYEFVDHVLLKYRDHYIDGDGIQTRSKIRRKWGRRHFIMEHQPENGRWQEVRRMVDPNCGMSGDLDEDKLAQDLKTELQKLRRFTPVRMLRPSGRRGISGRELDLFCLRQYNCSQLWVRRIQGKGRGRAGLPLISAPWNLRSQSPSPDGLKNDLRWPPSSTTIC